VTIEWVVGIVIGLLTLVGGIIARDRSLNSTIASGDAASTAAVVAASTALTAAIKAGDDALHERLNRVREDYVRRVDLDGHLTRLDETMKDVRSDMQAHNSDMTGRIDKLIMALAKQDAK
jgi:hypothetical protein